MGGDRVDKKILWVSACVPYDKVTHAGGQTENYYVKYLAKAGYEINIVSLCKFEEQPLLDLEEYGIESNVIVQGNQFYQKVFRECCRVEKEYNAFQKYAGMLDLRRERVFLKKLKKLANSQYRPDLIILEWTEIVLLIKKIKEIFPSIPIFATEEDVAYLGFRRRMEYETNQLRRKIYSKQYKKLKRLELNALKEADRIITNNPKDRKLLVKDGVDSENLFTWSPYFNNMRLIERMPNKKMVLFYGAMGRKENYLSVEWFVENVLPNLKDLDIQFVVLGSNPPERLQKITDKRVKITGFVEDITPYFAEAMCFVSPLVLGAGIKIKILEALSSGVPVLTNEIGIEGINAQDQKDYFYCETAAEYENVIRKIYSDEIDTQEIEKSARNFIEVNYSMEKSAREFLNLIERDID